MPRKETPSKPSSETTSKVGRVRKRMEKRLNRGFGPLEIWLMGSEDRVGGQGRVEDVEDTGDRESLGPQVGELRRWFEEGIGASSSREGLHVRQQDPALGRDPGKLMRK